MEQYDLGKNCLQSWLPNNNTMRHLMWLYSTVAVKELSLLISASLICVKLTLTSKAMNIHVKAELLKASCRLVNNYYYYS